MLKRGDRVRIIGSYLAEDFTEGTIVGFDIYMPNMLKVQFNHSYGYIDEIFLFKENSFSLFLMKLFKRKKYAEYKRTHKKCNEV